MQEDHDHDPTVMKAFEGNVCSIARRDRVLSRRRWTMRSSSIISGHQLLVPGVGE